MKKEELFAVAKMATRTIPHDGDEEHNRQIQAFCMGYYLAIDVDTLPGRYEDGYHNPSVQQHSADGAELAKRKLIDKACKWLHDNIVDYEIHDGRIYDLGKINAFKMAMEED